jgi:hypothetical protein
VSFSAVIVLLAISAWRFCCKAGVPAGVFLCCHFLPSNLCMEFLLKSWSTCMCLSLLSLSYLQSLHGVSVIKLRVPVLLKLESLQVSFPTVTVLLAICFSSSTCCRWSPYSVGFHAVLDVLLLQASKLLPLLLLLGSSCFSESTLFWHPCVLFWKYLNFLTSVLLFLCRSHRNQEQFYGSCLCATTVAILSVVKTTSIYINKHY